MEEVPVDRSSERSAVGCDSGEHEQAHALEPRRQLADVKPAIVVDDVPQVRSGARHRRVEQGLEVVELLGRFDHGLSPACRCSDRTGTRDAGVMADGTATDTYDGGRGAVVPILVYEDIEAGHDYLVSTFGFTSGGLHRSDDGAVVHGEVRMGDGVIWLHRVTPERQMISPRGAGMSHGGLSVLVPDVNAHFERAKAAGALIDASRPTRTTACASTAPATSRTTAGGSLPRPPARGAPLAPPARRQCRPWPPSRCRATWSPRRGPTVATPGSPGFRPRSRLSPTAGH